MKDYLSRLKSGCKNHTFIIWWLMRILILIAFVGNFFSEHLTLTGQLQIIGCLVGTFLWEISMAMPENSLFRFLPTSIHTAVNVGLFISAFCGVFLNLYYDMRWFDPIMAAYFGFVSVLYGYEVGYAIVRKDKFSATKAMVFFAAFGVSFILLTLWELGEFTCDQIIGIVTGEVGDAQFWSYALSESTARAETVIPAVDSARRPLMDIMADIVIHTLSAFAALIFINVYPYRLRGKYRYDLDFGNNDVKKTGKCKHLKVSFLE